MKWWREHRAVFWIHGRWEWGWLGNGWNRLSLGKITVYFPSGVSPLSRSYGWLDDDTGPNGGRVKHWQGYSAEEIENILASWYTWDPVEVARVCDEELDRSGALLGRVRALVSSSGPESGEE